MGRVLPPRRLRARALEEGAAGHGCGHNLFGAGSLGAAQAVDQFAGGRLCINIISSDIPGGIYPAYIATIDGRNINSSDAIRPTRTGLGTGTGLGTNRHTIRLAPGDHEIRLVADLTQATGTLSREINTRQSSGTVKIYVEEGRRYYLGARLTGNRRGEWEAVVWKVEETAHALFEVDDYVNFVQIQSEAALRNLGTSYPYEPHDDSDGFALRSHPMEISHALRDEIQDRLSQAGVTVIEARISHLAYAPEIANAMLRRQQASAIIAARQQIVHGAVGMVDLALKELDENNVVELDEERKASMVSNLLVVLCSDEAAQPVLNTSSLYT